jgi:hypothetical protein
MTSHSEDSVREVRIVFKYDGSLAATGELAIHDASTALRGITRATVITAHAFLNDGAVRSRTDSFKGGQVFVNAPRRGSYEQLVRIVFDPVFIAGMGGGLVTNAFWDFLKWTWGATVGKETEPSSTAMLDRRDRIEPKLGDITAALGRPMEEMHKPIEQGDAAEMGVNRPRVGRILTLDEDTLKFVSSVTESKEETLVSGNVTRFNVLSGFGRMFDDRRGETVSFLVDAGLSQSAREWITWSLDQRNRHRPGKVLFKVTQVVGRGDELIRYLVRDVVGNPGSPF